MYAKSRSSASTLVFAPLSSEKKIDPIGNVFMEAGSNLMKSELGAYGGKIFGSSSAFLQSNCVSSRYLSDPHYYFLVNEDYVKNKVKMILFPYLHKVCKQVHISVRVRALFLILFSSLFLDATEMEEI